jgi:hypothetical protein
MMSIVQHASKGFDMINAKFIIRSDAGFADVLSVLLFGIQMLRGGF